MKRSVLSLLFLFVIIAAQGQLQVISAPVTPSNCYNDGTLRVNVSGGTAPYSYSIISGPVLPNVNYPIFPDNANTFLSLHSGNYIILISDNAGDSINYNVTISGNYAFPILADTVRGDSIFLFPSLGMPPDSFALSSVGSNGPFGPYQSSSVFYGLCNGTYYARVKDSCGNFYTTSGIRVEQLDLTTYGACFPSGGIDRITVNVPVDHGTPPFTFRIVNGSYDSTNNTGIFSRPAGFLCPDTIYVEDHCNHALVTIVDCRQLLAISFCSNFSDSSATVVVTGGTPPYTYEFSEIDSFGNLINGFTQDSGHFVHIPYTFLGSTVQFDVIDACGRRLVEPLIDIYLRIIKISKCPFDSILNVRVFGALGAYTITCTNCNPVQVITDTTASPLFYPLDTGIYYLRASDFCGEIRYDTVVVPRQQYVLANYEFVSCNDVVVHAYSSDNVLLPNGVEFTLFIYNVDHWDSITTNSSGLFPDLARGNYLVILHHFLCRDAQLHFDVDHFENYCVEPYYANNCELRLILRFGGGFPYVGDLPETYSFFSALDTLYETPPGPYNGAYFDIAPGVYVAHSDSGCTFPPVQLNFDLELAETHTTDCISQGTIKLFPAGSTSMLCHPDSLIYTLDNGNMILTKRAGLHDSISFSNLSLGTYTARVFLADTTVFFADTLLPTLNRSCAIDSIVIDIQAHEVPVINAQNVTVCGSSSLADIPFTITGGLAPFDISIAGFTGIHTFLSSGSLSNIPLGNYTMIVHDTCGISSSLSVSIVDSCVNCDTVKAVFEVSRNSVCVGDTVFFNNLFDAGVAYIWSVNGNIFSHSPDTSLIIINSGINTIKCFLDYICCVDSFSLNVEANENRTFELGKDTFYCDAFVHILTTGDPETVWSTGEIGASITVSSPDTIRAGITDACGNFSDTIIITRQFTPEIDLGNDTVFCESEGLVLRAHARDAELDYVWSTGSTDDSLVIFSSGVYRVTVSSSGCSVIDSISITADFVGDILIADTLLCSGETITLTPREGTNPIWQDGSQFATFTVSDSGTYSVSVRSDCGNISDSVRISFKPCPMRIPDAFTPNGDGLNDYFTVFAKGITEYEIRIYNRWGEMVYRSNELNEGWDGSFKGSMQSLGTFVYLIEGLTAEGKPFREKGNLTLIR